MRIIIMHLLCLVLPSLIAAQNTVVNDTTYFTIGTYTTTGTVITPQKSITKVRIKRFINGDEQTYIENLGDSLQSQTKIVEDYLSSMNVFFGRGVSYIVTKPETLKQRRQLQSQLNTLGMPSLNDLIQTRFENEIIGSATVRLNQDTTFSADIIKNNQGTLRLLYSNKGYRIEMYSDKVLNVVDWPVKGDDTLLFLIKPKTYSSEDRNLILTLKTQK